MIIKEVDPGAARNPGAHAKNNGSKKPMFARHDSPNAGKGRGLDETPRTYVRLHVQENVVEEQETRTRAR